MERHYEENWFDTILIDKNKRLTSLLRWNHN